MGWFGSIDPAPYWNGRFAEDEDNFTWQFQYDLWFGSEGHEVLMLQTALQILGYFPANRKLTTEYATVTRTAVEKFQLEYKIVWMPWRILGFGRFGPKTRATLNNIMSVDLSAKNLIQ